MFQFLVDYCGCFKGPQTWSKTFPGARGHHQSPINVETNSTRYDEKLALNPLVIDYDHHSCSQIRNTGHTFQVDGYKSNLSSNPITPIFCLLTN